jgi:hypothetical protein
METRTYADLFETIEALCGVSFAAVEQPRIRALVNRRATKAYRATNYWPRFLVVGEERVVTSSVIPYEENSIDSIDTFLRIHKTAPYYSATAQDFVFHVGASGATLVCGDLDPESAFVTYKSQHTALYGTNSTDSTDVPKEWFDYIAHGTYSDFMRGEGQQEKAALADAEAMEILTDELMRADEQTPPFLKNRISTNANQQSR